MCGVGFIADLRGESRRSLLPLALTALSRLAHRGAVDADGRTGDDNNRSDGEETMRYVLLLLPCVLALAVPLYNSIEPRLFGFPFFYWFQLGWIFVSMIITAVVYYGTEPR